MAMHAVAHAFHISARCFASFYKYLYSLLSIRFGLFNLLKLPRIYSAFSKVITTRIPSVTSFSAFRPLWAILLCIVALTQIYIILLPAFKAQKYVLLDQGRDLRVVLCQPFEGFYFPYTAVNDSID